MGYQEEWLRYAKDRNMKYREDMRVLKKKDRLVFLRGKLKSFLSKSEKEDILRECRHLEKDLGYPPLPYNKGATS